MQIEQSNLKEIFENKLINDVMGKDSISISVSKVNELIHEKFDSDGLQKIL